MSKAPKHPVAIVGSGIAGLSAAWTLLNEEIPAVVFERGEDAGGRLRSRRGDGWIADHGTPFFNKNDETITGLVRETGLEVNRVSVQGGIHRLHADGTIECPPDGGVDTNRMCIDRGFSHLTSHLVSRLKVRYNVGVGAIRWDNSEEVFWWEKGSCFWLQDEHGDPVRDEITREVFQASGVILATQGTVAREIAHRSKSLQEVAPLLADVSYSASFTGIFKVPRVHTNFYALEGVGDCRLSWLAFEDRKAPERARPEHSILVVHASPSFSGELMVRSEDRALRDLYDTARSVVPALAAQPITSSAKVWKSARATSKPIGRQRLHVNPDTAPFALAGDYILGPDAEDAARSGVEAAKAIIAALPKRRSFLGIELQG